MPWRTLSRWRRDKRSYSHVVICSSEERVLAHFGREERSSRGSNSSSSNCCKRRSLPQPRYHRAPERRVEASAEEEEAQLDPKRNVRDEEIQSVQQSTSSALKSGQYCCILLPSYSLKKRSILPSTEGNTREYCPTVIVCDQMGLDSKDFIISGVNWDKLGYLTDQVWYRRLSMPMAPKALKELRCAPALKVARFASHASCGAVSACNPFASRCACCASHILAKKSKTSLESCFWPRKSHHEILKLSTRFNAFFLKPAFFAGPTHEPPDVCGEPHKFLHLTDDDYFSRNWASALQDASVPELIIPFSSGRVEITENKLIWARFTVNVRKWLPAELLVPYQWGLSRQICFLFSVVVFAQGNVDCQRWACVVHNTTFFKRDFILHSHDWISWNFWPTSAYTTCTNDEVDIRNV